MNGSCGCCGQAMPVATEPGKTGKPTALLESYVQVPGERDFAEEQAGAGLAQQWILVSPFRPVFRREADQ